MSLPINHLPCIYLPKRVVFRESYCFKYNSLSYIELECLHARIKSEVGWIETKWKALNEPQCPLFHNVSIIAILSSILLEWPRLQIIWGEDQFSWLKDESLLFLDWISNIPNLINNPRMFNGATDKGLLQWICCKCLAWWHRHSYFRPQRSWRLLEAKNTLRRDS